MGAGAGEDKVLHVAQSGLAGIVEEDLGGGAVAGTDTIQVGDGEAARDAAAQTRYDMVFMDCHMPVMDGFEAARRIREEEAQTGGARTPIVALTALALTGDRERCLDSGMDDYMTKPVRAAQLAEAVRRWAGGGPVLV